MTLLPLGVSWLEGEYMKNSNQTMIFRFDLVYRSSHGGRSFSKIHPKKGRFRKIYFICVFKNDMF